MTLVVGTDKGAFVAHSDERRRDWRFSGPLFKGWKVTAVTQTDGGDFLAATSSYVYGCAIHRSRNLTDWRQVEQPPAYTESSGRSMNQVWRMAASHGVLYAGVDEAGLFRSTDDGEFWKPVTGLNDHATRSQWQPGAGGLCAHAILGDPARPDRLWCGISAVGVFRSDDGGNTWHSKNQGVPYGIQDKEFPEIGFCVHALEQDPSNADTIYRQDHKGMFRSRNAGDSWERIEHGLPSGFGFPLARDRLTGALFAVPLESEEFRMPANGRLDVYRSTDHGDSWHARGQGLPKENAYTGVLRSALAVDHLDPGGVYLGTTSGNVFVSNDGGESYQPLPVSLPRIFCLAAFTDED